MPVAYPRAHTRTVPPPSWTDSGLASYRQYNKNFEAYLAAGCAPSVKPYLSQPSHIFAKYASAYAISVQRDAANIARNLILHGLFIKHPIFSMMMAKWHDMSVEEREDLCLQVWEQSQRRAETADFDYRRCECPELTLEWAEDPYNFDALISAMVFDESAGVSYRHVPNKDFDRLNGTDSKSTVPLSAGQRSFCEEGKVMRALYLAQFASQVIRAIAS